MHAMWDIVAKVTSLRTTGGQCKLKERVLGATWNGDGILFCMMLLLCSQERVRRVSVYAGCGIRVPCSRSVHVYVDNEDNVGEKNLENASHITCVMYLWWWKWVMMTLWVFCIARHQPDEQRRSALVCVCVYAFYFFALRRVLSAISE